jgi:hypothetical protein
METFAGPAYCQSKNKAAKARISAKWNIKPFFSNIFIGF